MPAPGDQYKGGDVKNPFEERVVNGFTASEIATLQSRLNKQLGPEYISQRPGNGGGKVAYLEGNKAIALANEVFGFNGWSSSLGQVQIDYVDELQNGKVSLGLSIVVRITLKDGTYHEDIGYGSIENGKGKAASFEKAKKEAATDGLKRALRTFGNVLGNCLYDKQYLKKVQAMSVKPIKFQEDNLYRHTDFTLQAPASENQAMIKLEPQRMPGRPNQVLRTRTGHLNESFSADFDDETDENLFDGVDVAQGHGIEASSDSLSASDSAVHTSIAVARPNGVPSARASPTRNIIPPRQHPQRPLNAQAGRGYGGAPQQHQNSGTARTGQPAHNQCQPQTPVHQNQPRTGQGRGQVQPITSDNGMPSRGTGPQQQNPQNVPQNQPTRPTPPPQQQQHKQSRPAQPAQGLNPPVANLPSNNRPSVGFVTSRAAEMVQKAEALPTHVPAFNPNVESPIPKEQRTPGFDTTRSAPIKREAVGIAPAPQPLPGPPARASSVAPGGGATNFNRPNVVNPHLDANRRIGAPGYAMSPTANRGAYKPPTFANANGAPANALKRPALQDVSNHTSASSKVDDEGGHAGKKQKVEPSHAENTSAVADT